METNSKLLIQAHSAVSLIVSLSVYFFAKEIAEAIFFGSLACNVYLRMLCFNFQGILNTSDLFVANGNDISVQNTNIPKKSEILLTIISGLRMAIIAGAFALFILKFKLNLIGLSVSFILYKLVLLLSGFWNKTNASHNGTDTRSNSSH